MVMLCLLPKHWVILLVPKGCLKWHAIQVYLARVCLYKALSGEHVPSLDTVLKVIGALGLTLRAEPIVSEEGEVTSYTAESRDSSISNNAMQGTLDSA